MADIEQVLANALGVNSLLGTVSGNFVFPTGVLDFGNANKFIYFSPFELVKAGDALVKGAENAANQITSNITSSGTFETTGLGQTLIGGAVNTAINAFSALTRRDEAINSRLVNKKPTNEVGSIALPIPPNITDSSAYEFSNDELGRAAQILSQVGSDISQGSSVPDALKRAAPSLISGAISNAVGVAGAVVGIDNAGGLVRSSIGAPNPFMKLNFSGIGFKEHQFQFHLVARNQADADAILKIISIFKYFSAPTGRDGSIFDVRYAWDLYFSQEVEQYMFKFKPCYLVAISTSYNTMGMSAFHSNGAPVDVVLTLTFRELVVDSQETYNEQYGNFLDRNGIAQSSAGVQNGTQTRGILNRRENGFTFGGT